MGCQDVEYVGNMFSTKLSYMVNECGIHGTRITWIKGTIRKDVGNMCTSNNCSYHGSHTHNFVWFDSLIQEYCRPLVTPDPFG